MIVKISKIKLESSWRFDFGSLQIFWIFIVLQIVNFWKFVDFSYCKILDISQFSILYNSGILLLFQFRKFWKFPTCEILKNFQFGNLSYISNVRTIWTKEKIENKFENKKID